MSSDLGATIIGLAVMVFAWLRDTLDIALHSPFVLGVIALWVILKSLERLEARLKEANAILGEMNSRLARGRLHD